MTVTSPCTSATTPSQRRSSRLMRVEVVVEPASSSFASKKSSENKENIGNEQRSARTPSKRSRIRTDSDSDFETPTYLPHVKKNLAKGKSNLKEILSKEKQRKEETDDEEDDDGSSYEPSEAEMSASSNSDFLSDIEPVDPTLNRNTSSSRSPRVNETTMVSRSLRSQEIAMDPSSSDLSDAPSNIDEEEVVARRPRQRRPRAPRRPRGTPKISATELAEKNLSEWHPELNVDWDQLGVTVPAERSKIQAVEQPPQLVEVKLLPFQLEGLAWLQMQEESLFQGGILSDSMGMGKTLQTIALLVSRPLGKPTLVVCPVVALIQWKEEIAKYTRHDYFQVLIFHGTNRCDDVHELARYDIILTTYAVLESSFRKQQSGFNRKGRKLYENSILHQMHWGRVVLDEAHCIKDRSCSTARAAFALNADKKWSLSGTPLQNRVGELYSLIRFMKISPYSNYYCKKCPCKSMVWKFSDNSHCDQCGHKPMQHFCWWNKVILKPIQRFGAAGEGMIAYKRLYILLDMIMLRRTKVEKAEELGLPPKIVEHRLDFFNEKEEDFYKALYSESQTQFESYVRAGTVLNHYAHIFELLSRLRQAADHPFLVVHKSITKENPGTYVCGLCHDVAEEPIAASCKHVFCREDIKQYLTSYLGDPERAECPICFVRLRINLDQPELPPPSFETARTASDKPANSTIVERMLNANPHGWQSSTKIEALLEELTKLRRLDRTIKSIVFSQFVSFLDLIHWRLRKQGFYCVKLDGRMSPEQRDAVIKSFMTVPQVTVFLVSLKAGGVALNLTEASRVFLMDPWWNPAVEHQAMDRIHRLGQYRPVRITRLIIENSIESRIVQLQEKKELLFQSTVGKDATAMERLTEEDLQFLFQN